MDAAGAYRAAAVVGFKVHEVSLWEFQALVIGWQEANTPEGEQDQPAPMSDAEFDRLREEIG